MTRPLAQVILAICLTACSTGSSNAGGGVSGPINSADIVITEASLSGPVAVGRRPWVHFTYANRGSEASGPVSEIGVYLSSTADATPSDPRLGLLPMEELGPGAAISDSVRVHIPANAPTGPAYLTVIADVRHLVAESNRQNDLKALPLGTLARPPLAATGIILLWPDNPDDSVELVKGHCPRWSPDGSQLVFQRGDTIFTISSTGADERALGPGVSPVFSPTGARIAFVGSGSSPAVWIMNGDGTGRRQLTTAPVGATVDWSRSNVILFVQSADLFSINPDGTNLRRLTSDSYLDQEPRWTPDGRSIVFVTWRFSPSVYTEVAKIGLLGPGGGVRQLSWGEENDSDPVVSPDGGSLVYTVGGLSSTTGTIVSMSNPTAPGRTTARGVCDWR